MKKERILIVDDNYAFIQGLRLSLEQDGFEVMVAANGADGLKAARRLRPSLIILDINMPTMDGLELCRRLRQDEHFDLTPILFLTSRTSVEDVTTGLDIGADDYLNKPFHTKELKARVRALLRRYTPPQGSGTDALIENDHLLQHGTLTLHLQGCWVRVNDGPRVQLTPAEFDLLQHLMSHPERPFSSEELLESVWAYEPGTADPSLARWHIRNLRSKIEPDPRDPQYIRTIPRHGYMLNGKMGRA